MNYGEVAAAVLAVIEGPAYDLVETVAQQVADACLAFDGVEAVEVVVHKPEAPVGVPFRDVVVTIVRHRVSGSATRRAALGLGANLGDRVAALQGAVDLIAPRLDDPAVSSVYETAPVGGPEQPDYANAVLVGDWAGRAARAARARARGRAGVAPHPRDPLGATDSRRRRARRRRPGERRPGPHAAAPAGAERAFVLVPWAEADPEATLPDGTAVADLAAALAPDGRRTPTGRRGSGAAVMTPTRPRLLVALVVVSAAVGWGVVRLVDAYLDRSLPVPWTAALVMLVLAIALALWARGTRARLARHARAPSRWTRSSPRAPPRSRWPRRAPARSSPGFYAGVAVGLLPGWSVPYVRERVIVSAVTVLLGVARRRCGAVARAGVPGPTRRVRRPEGLGSGP